MRRCITTFLPHPAPAAALALAAALLCAAPASAGGTRPDRAPDAAQAAQAAPDDAAKRAQYAVLREYFTRSATLDDRLPELFSRRVRDEETRAFLLARSTIARRGQLLLFRNALVDLSGLVFTRVTADPDLARIRVTGSYSFTVAPTTENAPPVTERIREDALYVLLPEMGQWKIFERRPGWRP